MPYDLIYMWNLKYDTNELTYEIETDSQTQRTDYGCQGGAGEGMDWEFGIDTHTVLYLKWITNKNLL